MHKEIASSPITRECACSIVAYGNVAVPNTIVVTVRNAGRLPTNRVRRRHNSTAPIDTDNAAEVAHATQLARRSRWSTPIPAARKENQVALNPASAARTIPGAVSL